MAIFVHGSDLNSKIEKIISEADKFLYLVCPYFKLHRRIEDELKAKMPGNDPDVVIVYGKNEDNRARSLNDDNIRFLSGFRNIRIYYKPDLHAKFYCSEDAALVTSMNLHEYSQNNNIEMGVLLLSEKGNSRHRDFKGHPDTEAYNEAIKSFDKIIKGEEAEFTSGPAKGYTSEPDTNYGKVANTYYSKLSGSAPANGYCIRTGVPIPFNPSRPMSYTAFQTWAEFQNPDYPEKHCHRRGRKSNGRISMRNPIMN